MLLLVAKGRVFMADKPSDLRPGHARYAHPKNVGAGAYAWIWISVRIEQMSKGVFASTRARYFSPFND